MTDEKELLKQIEEITNKLNASKINKIRIAVSEAGYEFEVLSSELLFEEIEEKLESLMKKGFYLRVKEIISEEDDPSVG